VKPSSSSATPTSETEATTTAKEAQTLPFTGLNLVWMVGAGLLLLAAGVTLLVVQRRRAHR
jgi:LPXTG-motif cell wall-anchored protein